MPSSAKRPADEGVGSTIGSALCGRGLYEGVGATGDPDPSRGSVAAGDLRATERTGPIAQHARRAGTTPTRTCQSRTGEAPWLNQKASSWRCARLSNHFFQSLSDLEFGDGGGAACWWPLGKKDKSVVIDPRRALGRPIITSAGVPTAVWAAAYQAEGQDADVVAHWYDRPKAAVLKAVAFERRLAA